MAYYQPHTFDSPWASTVTTTIQTRLTATSNQASITINYPWPALTAPTSYTTITRNTNVVPKVPPNLFMTHPPFTLETVVMPILVLTNVEAVIVNTAGKTINRATLVQPPPSRIGGPDPTNLAVSTTGEGQCGSDFNCWSTAQKAGTLVAVIVVGGGTLFLIFSIFKKCIDGKKSDVAGEPDVERGHGRPGGDSGKGGLGTPIPLNPLSPVALVPDTESEDAKPKKYGALFLWRKKSLVRDAPQRSTSSSAVYGMPTSNPTVFMTSAIQPMPAIVNPIVSMPYVAPAQENSSSTIQDPSIRKRDFAYRVTDDGKLQKFERLPPIATVDADSAERERRRQERRDRRTDTDAVLEQVAAVVMDKREEEDRAYDKGHRHRHRKERSRSQVSENYERRGDRLRKESPDAKAEERAEKKESEKHHRKLRAQKVSPDRRRSSESGRRSLFKRSQDSLRERFRGKSSSTRGRSSSPDVRFGGHIRKSSRSRRRETKRHGRSSHGKENIPNDDRGDYEGTGEGGRRKSVNPRKYPPLSYNPAKKQDISHLQVGLDEYERAGSIDLRRERVNENDRVHNSKPRHFYAPAEARDYDEMLDYRLQARDSKQLQIEARDQEIDNEKRRSYQEHRVHKRYSTSPRRRSGGARDDRESKKTSKTSKLMTLLPIALAAIDALAEPDGGWEQYHRKEKNSGVQRSNSVDEALARRRRRLRNGQFPDGDAARYRASSLDSGAGRYREDSTMKDSMNKDASSKTGNVAVPASQHQRRPSRKHVRIVRREHSSEATVLRGGGETSTDDVERKKRVRISDHVRGRTPSQD